MEDQKGFTYRDYTQVFNRDCMEGMKDFPNGYFDLAIVDPEYGLGLDFTNKNGLRKGRKNQRRLHKDKDWNNKIPSSNYFKELHRVSKHQIIWGCNYYAKYIPAVGRIIHDKKMPSEGTSINFSHADIASCSFQKRITMFRYAWAGSFQGGVVNWDNDGLDGRIHPTQKPVHLYKYCLGYAKPGDKILDTHLGSGSSRIAAFDMGFEFTGFEIDPDYFADAEKRFNQHKSQLKLYA